MIVTQHALARYRTRVADISDDAIRLALDTSAVRLAISFGAPYVKLGTGQRVVLVGGHVVTVLPSDTRPRTLGRSRDNLHRRGRHD